MQWIEHEQANGFHFWTLEENEPIAELKFSPDSKAFRLHHNDHRLFFLEYGGVLQQKIVLNSEYGVELGEIHLQKVGHYGALIVNDIKYYYIEDNTGLHLFDKHKQMLASFGIDHNDDLNVFERSALLFALAWIFPAVTAESPYYLVNGLAV